MTQAFDRVNIVGAGLAGSEAALLLARAGINVALYEQKPQARTPAQVLDGPAELVRVRVPCSSPCQRIRHTVRSTCALPRSSTRRVLFSRQRSEEPDRNGHHWNKRVNGGTKEAPTRRPSRPRSVCAMRMPSEQERLGATYTTIFRLWHDRNEAVSGQLVRTRRLS